MSRPSRTKQQRALRAFILICGGFVLLCFLAADPVLRTFRKRDLKDAVPQQGVATVVTLVLPAANMVGDTKGDLTPLVGVRFHDGIHTAARVYNVRGLQIGQPARVQYRMGKSGAVVVDSVEPLDAAH